MDKVGVVPVLRLNIAERSLQRLRLPTDGTVAIHKKERRGISVRRAKPVTVTGHSRIPWWPKSKQYILWQAGDGDPLDLSAEKNYQDDKKKVTEDEVGEIEDEHTNEELIRVEHPPTRYTIAHLMTITIMVVILFALILFAVLIWSSGGLNFEMPTGPSFAVMPFIGALAPTMRRFSPTPPPMLGAAWRWVWEAAKIEPRVAGGMLASGLIVAVVGGYFTLLSLFTATTGDISGTLFTALFGFLVTFGAAVPTFVVIAFPKLFFRRLVFAPRQDHAVEDWVHPKTKTEYAAEYLFQDGRSQVLVMTADGRPFTGREKYSGISDEEIFDITDTSDVGAEVRPKAIPYEKIEMVLIVAILGMSFFFLLVLREEFGKVAG